jgi:hypothetical protein
MELLRAGVERLLLLLLRLAQMLFLLQAAAAVCAFLATQALAPQDTPDWLRSAMVSTLLLSATFGVAGMLMSAARRWIPADEAGHPVRSASVWPLGLGLSLVAFSALASIAALGLPAVWSQIGVRLEAVGFWEATTRADPYGGIVLLPIVAALIVPSLTTAAAVFSIAFPLALLPLLATRSRLFPSLLARGAICQGALLLGGWFAVDALADLATQAMASMNASGDEVRASDELSGAVGALTRATIALAPPLAGVLVWMAILRPAGAAAAYFTHTTTVSPANLDDALQALDESTRRDAYLDAARRVDSSTTASRF